MMTDVNVVIDEKGYFSHFENEEKQTFKSLKDLIEKYKSHLEWEYKNSSTEQVANGRQEVTRQG